VENLQLLFDHCAERATPGATEFFTYSASTAVRASFLAAGFHVARGNSTGHKGETTIICTAGALRWRAPQLLGKEWLEKWERSGARWPLTLAGDPEPDLLELVRNHPQFKREVE
jgi:hypothetical protein